MACLQGRGTWPSLPVTRSGSVGVLDVPASRWCLGAPLDRVVNVHSVNVHILRRQDVTRRFRRRGRTVTCRPADPLPLRASNVVRWVSPCTGHPSIVDKRARADHGARRTGGGRHATCTGTEGGRGLTH